MGGIPPPPKSGGPSGMTSPEMSKGQLFNRLFIFSPHFGLIVLTKTFLEKNMIMN
jgi:hypothetical protein